MEFYLVVLIFISCMIALALLIYYCQEYRNPKYSFTDNQRDISAIALAIGVPGFHPGEYRTAPHYPGSGPTCVPPPPPPGFAVDVTPSAPYPPNNLPPCPLKPLLREFAHRVIIPEDSSDDSSTSSEQIYYAPKTAAYSVAKRMSVSANIARRMSAAVNPPEARPSMAANVAAFLIAKRMSRNLYRKETNTPIDNKSDDIEDAQKNATDSTSVQILENTAVPSFNAKSGQQQKDEHKSTSPYSSETASTRSSVSRIGDSEESKKRRSISPYIPATVAGFHLRSKNTRSRSGSPYTSLENDSPCAQEQINDLPTAKKSENPSTNPSPPKRNKKSSLKPAENHPLKYTKKASPKLGEESENALPKQSESVPAQHSVAARSESLPPTYSKNLPTKRSESLPPKENKYTSDRLPLTSSEISYRSHSPTPLHTVEEED